ncbi:hypothetical protein [Thermococcus sp.]|uniref:hypothetical protein n=1 Tax=Thermococcus sp. TaxID=35749 RepID=UPI0026076517|nr:hypothetical protein [Thermococcus sp.]
MPSYKVTVALKSAGDKALSFDSPIKLGGIIVKSENKSDSNSPVILVEMTVDSQDLGDAKETATSLITEQILPVIVLCGEVPYEISDIKIIDLDPRWVIIGSKTIYVKVVPNIKEVRLDEFFEIFKSLKNLDEDSKSVLFRAIKYWNRAMSDPDPIDKFLNLYIALELLKGLLLRKEPSEKKREWVNTLYEKYNFNGLYGGYKINYIRNALLHYQKKVLSKEEAERIIEKHVDEFGREIFNLMKDYVECGGDTECLQKKRQQRNRS